MKAKCPEWHKFLESVFRNDQDLITFVQRAAGYSLTGDTSEHVFFILHGCGRNGKSTLLTMLRAITGDYAQQVRTETIMEKKYNNSTNDLAELRGTRLATAVETTAGRKLAEDVVKNVTGGDPIRARFLYKENFEYVPQFKLWLACNHKPRIDGTDEGIWSRVRLLPFDVRYQDADAPEGPYKDTKLTQKLQAEAPGILAWAVQGCLDWQKNGLNKPSKVMSATDGYRADMDYLGAFLGEVCVLLPQAHTGSTELYNAYCAWSERNKERAMSLRRFSLALSERGSVQKTLLHGRYIWRGIGLIEREMGDGVTFKGHLPGLSQVDFLMRENPGNGSPRSPRSPQDTWWVDDPFGDDVQQVVDNDENHSDDREVF